MASSFHRKLRSEERGLLIAAWSGPGLFRFIRQYLNIFSLAVVLLLGRATSGISQQYIPEYQFYGLKEGLSHREVHDILQDRQGYIWIATLNGLNRFDGYTFQIWGKDQGFRAQSFYGIFEDLDGYLWVVVGPTFLLELITPTRDSVLHFEHLEANEGPDRRIGECITKYGLACIKTSDTYYFQMRNGVAVLKRGQDVQPIQMEGFPTDDATAHWTCCFITPRHTFWGMLKRKKGDTVIEMDQNGRVMQRFEAGGEVLSYAKSNQSGNWNQQDFYFIDPAYKRARRLRISIDGTAVVTDCSAILPALKRLQINSIYSSLSQGNVLQNNFIYINANNGRQIWNLENYDLLSGLGGGFLEDRSGAHWHGMAFGLARVQMLESHFKRLLFNENTKIKGISSRGIVETSQGLWINTESGRFLFETGSNQERKLGENLHYGIGADQEETVYCFYPGGLVKYEAGKVDAPQTMPVGGFLTWMVCPDPKGRIWYAGDHPLTFYSPRTNQIQKFEAYNGFDALKSSHIFYMKPDQNAEVWLCTSSGFYRMDWDKGIQERFWFGAEKSKQLPVESVYHYYQDEEGVYWLATNGDGLVRWDRKKGTVRKFNQSNGIPNNTIYAVYEDKHRHLWLPTDNGLVQFDKSTEMVRRVYLPEDGITHQEFNRGSHYQGRDGTLYFGGLNGVTAFHPDDFYTDTREQTFPLVITKLQQYNGARGVLEDRTLSLLQSNEIVLQPGDRYFDLEFSLLAYRQQEKVRYFYKIEGVDPDWVSQNDHHLRINQLPYGTHTLHIRGQALSGLWGENDLSVLIRVLRPFYMQVWFWFLCLAISVWGIRRFFKWRTAELKQNKAKLEKEVAEQTATIREQAESLRELDAVKTRLYTNITHEFRTPLTVIKGLADEINGNEKSKQLITRNAGNLLTLVNQMLDLSKVEAGNMRVHLIQADIVPYLRYLTESFYSMAQDKGIRLVFNTEVPELMMDFDEEKVQYIVYNLLSNAIKFTPSGKDGLIQFLLETTTMNAQKVLSLKVIDNGIGIPAEKLPNIFERFYQVDDSHTRKGEGTGIGLTLTKELVQLMGGSIGAKSIQGQGTAFSVVLPISNQAAVQTISYVAKVAPAGLSEDDSVFLANEGGEKPLLLLIEDNRDVAFYIQTILSSQYEVIHASNGQAGLDQAFERVPDIVISDVMMPEKDGYEVCAALKEDERTSHIPVILLTAKATDEDKIAGLKTGADAYLMKPFHKEELFVRLEQLLRLRHTLQERFAGAILDVPPKTPAKEPSLDELFVEKLRQAVLDKIDDPALDVPYLCRVALLSQVQVFRKLKALTGLAPSLFIRSIRLQRAKELLLSTQLNVSEIAYKTGFSDPNYFSRAFSEAFGQPPSAFRK